MEEEKKQKGVGRESFPKLGFSQRLLRSLQQVFEEGGAVLAWAVGWVERFATLSPST